MSGTSTPFASSALALSWAVVPTEKSVTQPGNTSTSATTCSTFTVAPPDTVPVVAVTTALPFLTAVTRPSSSTAATESLLDHSNTCLPGTPLPSESSASASNRNVSPMAISVAESGDTRTCATICSTVTVATPVAAPLAAVTTALPFPIAVTRPNPSTRTTDASVDVYPIGTPVISSPFWLSTVAA
ncbi:MAG: hypothetical protein OXI12_07110, partial [Gammaproteobacteria bacterium]|nr:hypothetical protein [Gammaproteobacteria bacterium]